MKPIATDTYNFEWLMADRYTYVDKTKVFYPLVNKSIGSQFFLSRPRRISFPSRPKSVRSLKSLWRRWRKKVRDTREKVRGGE